MGTKEENCREGILRLSRIAAISAQSPFYRTEPVDYRDQDWFVNAAVCIRTELEPRELLVKLQAIQTELGRKKDTVRFGPRLLDLDILMVDDLVIKTPQLTVPHPRMHQRRFVLQPMCDIDPNIVHPVLKETVTVLLERLDEEGQALVRM